ncbi:GAF domain-containing sensor histidine kinase [Conexibacter sp. JD483]|uniref:sensor histidine kinase n=1 Tax=unclassified Conexibacter TaxID=2627773 RepID=UPI00271CEC95|nr:MULTISPECIES: GAF domain-containing sensor histidine kinase [unclassified Conexibacter]MDO8186957.1 GAF domain-containing sensor histidine kinase [Conexibacter sp. CPCC 205706]MDO8200588.1 GAF domain-containing sensor histidine kinase [Conexibacter sp. CPCC 205762]MDR9368834.1 GAF domain-containing sensor histidine kinase [Conexibacter sp. JD483]
MLDERRLRRILDVGRSVVAELDLETLLQRVLDEARALTGARYAALGILDERRAELERFLSIGIDSAQHAAIGDLPRGRGVLGVLIEEPRPLRLDDVSDHPRSYGFPLGHPPMHSFLGVPITIRGEAFGNLYLTEKAGGVPFDADDEEAIVLLAGWAAIAIDNARSYTREHRRRHELEQALRAMDATTAIARAVGGETDLERVLELIAKRARALVDARGVLILLREGDELAVATVAGGLAGSLDGLRVPVEGSVSGRVMLERRAQTLADARTELRFALGEQLDATSGLLVPLVFRGRPLGVLCAFDRDGDEHFTREDERLLESFAASAATAVATAQTVASEGLRRSIEASERERQRWARELHDETLQELAGLKVLLAGARRSQDLERVHGAIGDAIEQIDTEIAGLRRLIADLRPAALDAFGLRPALEGLAERVTATSGLDVELDVELAHDADEAAPRPRTEVEDAVYRLVQEALTNAVKHADASRVAVTVREHGGRLEVAVLDDGAGFDPGAATSGFGLLGMRERMALLDGRVTVTSAPGAGTTVTATVPSG